MEENPVLLQDEEYGNEAEKFSKEIDPRLLDEIQSQYTPEDTEVHDG